VHVGRSLHLVVTVGVVVVAVVIAVVMVVVVLVVASSSTPCTDSFCPWWRRDRG
jgi:hypothetical protein